MMENHTRLLHKPAPYTNIVQICDIEAAINNYSLGNYNNRVSSCCTIPVVYTYVYD